MAQCNYPGANGPCSNPGTGEDGRCWLESHAGDDPGDDAVDPDLGAPDGNFNGIDHGLNMGVQRRMDWFRELGDPYMALFEDYYVEFAGVAASKTQAADLASLAVIRDELEEHLLLSGVFYEDQVADPEELIESGMDPDEAWDKAFVDKPKTQTLEALDSVLKEVRLGLKYEREAGIDAGTGSGGMPDGVEAMWEERGEN